jgi:hypothetical protein
VTAARLAVGGWRIVPVTIDRTRSSKTSSLGSSSDWPREPASGLVAGDKAGCGGAVNGADTPALAVRPHCVATATPSPASGPPGSTWRRRRRRGTVASVDPIERPPAATASARPGPASRARAEGGGAGRHGRDQSLGEHIAEHLSPNEAPTAVFASFATGSRASSKRLACRMSTIG